MTKILITAVVFVATLALSAAAAFFAVMILAGPHGGVLPRFMEPVVLLFGWVLVLGVPVLAAHRVWRRLSRSTRQ